MTLFITSEVSVYEYAFLLWWACGYSPILVAFFRTFPGMTATMYSLLSLAEFLGRSLGGVVQYRTEIPEKKKYGFAFLVYMLYETVDLFLLWLPYPLMLVSREIGRASCRERV